MKTGADILTQSSNHLGEDYVLGAVVPLTVPNWRGPWDCSLMVSYDVYQVSGIVYGCIGTDPDTADPYTGAWAADAQRKGHKISVPDAMSTPGAALLRVGQRIGHIAISDGKGGTVEAKGAAYGVVEDTAEGRRWDMGVLVPGILYDFGPLQPPIPLPKIFRLTTPMMSGDEVREIQRALLRAGFNPADLDGIFGHQTVNAVIQFQRAKGLVVDGEVGPQTMQALGIR